MAIHRQRSLNCCKPPELVRPAKKMIDPNLVVEAMEEFARRSGRQVA